jgi:hypothetical protein
MYARGNRGGCTELWSAFTPPYLCRKPRHASKTCRHRETRTPPPDLETIIPFEVRTPPGPPGKRRTANNAFTVAKVLPVRSLWRGRRVAYLPCRDMRTGRRLMRVYRSRRSTCPSCAQTASQVTTGGTPGRLQPRSGLADTPPRTALSLAGRIPTAASVAAAAWQRLPQGRAGSVESACWDRVPGATRARLTSASNAYSVEPMQQ